MQNIEVTRLLKLTGWCSNWLVFLEFPVSEGNRGFWPGKGSIV